MPLAKKIDIANSLHCFIMETTDAVWKALGNVSAGMYGYFVEDYIGTLTSGTNVLVVCTGLIWESSPTDQADGGVGGTAEI
jgi:hypothetical protein